MRAEEAKTKVCPFMVNHQYTVRGKDCVDRLHTVNAKCIVDECMAWQTTWANGVDAPEDKTETGYCKRIRQ